MVPALPRTLSENLVRKGGPKRGPFTFKLFEKVATLGRFAWSPPFGAKTLRVLTAFPPRVLTNFPLRVLTAFSVRVLAAFRAVEKKRFIEDARGPSPRAFNSGPKGPRGGPGAQGAPGGGTCLPTGGPTLAPGVCGGRTLPMACQRPHLHPARKGRPSAP